MNSTTWHNWINTLPHDLAVEFIDERPVPDQEDIDVFTNTRLVSRTPIEVSIKALLNEPWMEGTVSRTPKHVVDAINQRHGTAFQSGLVYDRDPDRLMRYAKMNGRTAKPSVMLNGEVIFGVGRLIASLLRDDETLRVWKLVGVAEWVRQQTANLYHVGSNPIPHSKEIR